MVLCCCAACALPALAVCRFVCRNLANSTVVFDWPHEHMYARLRAEADLMLFDADDYLAWVNKRAIRSPSSGSADRNGAC